MTLTDLMPTIQSLNVADKLRLIQLLAADVAREEGIMLEFSNRDVPLWSQYDAFEGAATLLRFIESGGE